MSIKKGKKQVYKVGQEVQVVKCSEKTKAHEGQMGVIVEFATSLIGNRVAVVSISPSKSCFALEVSPLKPKKSIKKMYKVGKCPNTVTGEHKFVDTSYENCYTEVLYMYKPSLQREVPVSSRTHCTKAKRPIKCEYCQLVDDRPSSN